MSCEARSLRAGRKRDPPKGIETARGGKRKRRRRREGMRVEAKRAV